MSCPRCEDIHNAQRCGFTGKPCECDCHINIGYTWNDVINPIQGAPDPTVTCNTYVMSCDNTECKTLNLN